MGSYVVNKEDDVSGGRWKNQCSEEIDEDEEPHAKETEATHVFKREQHDQIVNSGVDPSSSL